MSGAPRRASRANIRSVASLPGKMPFTRTPRGASSSARSLTIMARPGRKPLLVEIPDITSRALVLRTKAIDAPVPVTSLSGAVAALATARAIRSGPRNATSNESRQTSSLVRIAVPGVGPPVLMTLPSRRPNRATAPATTRSAVVGSAISPGRPTACAAPPSSVMACATTASSRATMTTFAPSETSAFALAKPSPREPPVTTKTRSLSPKSIRP